MASSSGCAPAADGSWSPAVAARVANASRPDGLHGLATRFPKSSRLTSRRQFRAVYDDGLRVSCAEMAIFARPNGGDTTRLGITVTRKFGGAVQRNRAKRLIRELYRRHHEALPATPLDIVVNARPALRGRGTDELEPVWLRLLGDLDRRVRRRGGDAR